MKNSRRSILCVDDEPMAIEGLRSAFQAQDIAVVGCANGEEALCLLESSKEPFPVILLDYKLPDISGSELIGKVRELCPQSFVFSYSGDESRETLKTSLKSGADDFLEKNGDPETLEEIILDGFRRFEQKQNISLRPVADQSILDQDIITRSPEMMSLISFAVDCSKNKFAVLITGETGTGKEKFAELISKKHGGPFFAVNCSQFMGNEDRLESELFGHEKGAFTGADSRKKGYFEVASGGTLFLDEIDRMSLSAQAKLLRAIESKTIVRLGSTETIPVDIKILASSKSNIEDLKDQGKFLADLYGRINVFRLDVPALRDRLEDIDLLLKFFAEKHENSVGIKKYFDEPATELMKKYSWPENVRELENTYVRLAVHTKGNQITKTDLIRHFDFFATLGGPPVFTESQKTFKESQKDKDRVYLWSMLQKHDLNISKAANSLGMSRSTLHSKMKSLGLVEKRNQIVSNKGRHNELQQ